MAKGVLLSAAAAEMVLEAARSWMQFRGRLHDYATVTPPTSETLQARVTGQPSGSGYYPAVLTAWDNSAREWIDYQAVVLKPSNDETLAVGIRYPVKGAGADGDDGVFVTLDCCSAASGSDAWVKCLKRVTDVRCTEEGWEYDAEFDYISADGRILFTLDSPCGDEGGGGGGGGGGGENGCGTGRPATVLASFSAPECTCIDGLELTLSYDSQTDAYSGYAEIDCDGDAGNFTFSIFCTGTIGGTTWRITSNCVEVHDYTGEVAPQMLDLTWSGSQYCPATGNCSGTGPTVTLSMGA